MRRLILDALYDLHDWVFRNRPCCKQPLLMDQIWDGKPGLICMNCGLRSKAKTRRRDNDWMKILLLAVIAALMIVSIVAVSGMTHAAPFLFL